MHSLNRTHWPAGRPAAARPLGHLLRRWRRLALTASAALLAACPGGSETPTSPSVPQDPHTDPGVPAIYDLTTVDGDPLPALVSRGDLPGTIMRGYIDHGVLTMRADGTCRYGQQASLYTNGVLVNRQVTDAECTWTQPSEGQVTLRFNASGQTRALDRTWISLTERRRTVEGTADVEIPLVWVRR